MVKKWTWTFFFMKLFFMEFSKLGWAWKLVGLDSRLFCTVSLEAWSDLHGSRKNHDLWEEG